MFKAGDKVVCVNADYGLIKDKTYEVREYNPNMLGKMGGALFLVDQPAWGATRFKLVEQLPVVLPFVVGATVECLVDDYIMARRGQQYVINEVKLDELGGVKSIRMDGLNSTYSMLNRWKVVAPPVPVKEWNRDEWVPQVGEKVYITGEDAGFATAMYELIGNGVVYTIEHADDYIHLEDHEWIYYATGEALTPVNPQAIIQPLAPKPRPVHEYADLRDDLMSKPCSSLCSFAFEYEDGHRYYKRDGACHAYIGNIYGSADERGKSRVRTQLVYNLPHQIEIVRTKPEGVSGWCSLTTDEISHNQAADYIINRSPWAIAFLTKDMKEATKKGLFMNVELNVNVIAAACVALRSCMEHGYRSNIFKMLVDEDVGENAAFLTACAFGYKGQDNYSHYAWGGGHDILDSSRSLDGLVKFFKTGFHTEKGTVKEPWSTHHEQYVMAQACAERAERGEISIGKWFKDNTVETVTGEGFYKTSSITKQSLIDVANKLDKLLKD